METKETDGEGIDLGILLDEGPGYRGRTVSGAFDSLERNLQEFVKRNLTVEFLFPMRESLMAIRNQKDPT